jgi:membrane protease YdiL (CAAX protease family)
MSNRRALAAFLALTFAIDWGLVAGYLALGGQWTQPASTAIPALYMFGPAIAAIVVQRWMRRRPLAELGLRWRPNRWWTWAWLGPIAFALATVVVGWGLPGVSFDPTMADLMARFEGMFDAEQLAEMNRQVEALPVHPFWITLVQALVAGATINALFGLGEELGWRGLMHKLVRPLGFWRSSALVGLVWGLWHAPLILLGHNYPTHPQLGVLMMIVWTMLLAPPFTWVRDKTGSVVAAAVMHGSLNAAAGLPLMVTAGGGDLTIGVTGLAGFVVLAVVNVTIFVERRAGRGGGGGADEDSAITAPS